MENNIVGDVTQSQTSSEINLDALESMKVGETLNSSQNSNVHTKDDSQPLGEMEVDERFKGLPIEEGRFRTLQSKKDTAESAYNKLMIDFDERSQVAGLFDQMLEDENLLMAFINQVKPDLLKGRDVAKTLKDQLKTEFGEDFKPQLSRDEAERDDPFGQDYKYYMRLDELKGKLKGDSNGNAPKSVKEYLKAREAKELANKAKYDQELQAVKDQFKMNDGEVKAVSDWATKLKFADLVKVHRFLLKFPTRNPNLTDVTGAAPGTKSAREMFLDATMPKH